MPEIMQVLRERASESEDEKNEIYYTQKQKRVLKTIAENPHASANEIADIAEVHPSYIPYICERVDMGVVENLDRLEKYLSEREEMDDLPASETGTASVQNSGEEEEKLMETFGAEKSEQTTQQQSNSETTEFTFTREMPVEIQVRLPSEKINEVVEEEISEEEEEDDEGKRVLTAD